MIPCSPPLYFSLSEHDLKMRCQKSDLEEKDSPPPEEIECKICYQHYNAYSRKPKILDCLHRVCAQCLVKMLDISEGTGFISCPFCRHPTTIAESRVSALPDDANIMSHLAMWEKSWTSDHTGEVVLTPKSFSSSSPTQDSSNCLVITITEDQQDAEHSPHQNTSSEMYAEQSLDSVSVSSNGLTYQDTMFKFCNHIPRALVWLLGFLYFGSVPLGIYLLVLQRVTLGIVCVSLVPSSLTVCLVYEFCGVCARACVTAPPGTNSTSE